MSRFATLALLAALALPGCAGGARFPIADVLSTVQSLACKVCASRSVGEPCNAVELPDAGVDAGSPDAGL